jgi:hypothetical protein
MRFQVANCSEYVILKRGAVEISLARARGAAESAEIDCQDAKSFGHQKVSLDPPTLLVESAAVSQHNRSDASAIEVGANAPTIFGRKRDSLLCRCQRGQRERKHGSQHAHGGII